MSSNNIIIFVLWMPEGRLEARIEPACISIHLFIHPPKHQHHPSIHAYTYASSLFIYLPVPSLKHHPTYPSMYSCIIYPSACLSTYLSISHPSIHKPSSMHCMHASTHASNTWETHVWRYRYVTYLRNCRISEDKLHGREQRLTNK